MKRLNNNDRGAVSPSFLVGIGMCAVVLAGLGAYGIVSDRNTDQQTSALEESYGIEIVDETKVSDTPGDLTNVKVKLDGDILTCDVLTEKSGFTITCDSPDGRITLEER